MTLEQPTTWSIFVLEAPKVPIGRTVHVKDTLASPTSTPIKENGNANEKVSNGPRRTASDV